MLMITECGEEREHRYQVRGFMSEIRSLSMKSLWHDEKDMPWFWPQMVNCVLGRRCWPGRCVFRWGEGSFAFPEVIDIKVASDRWFRALLETESFVDGLSRVGISTGIENPLMFKGEMCAGGKQSWPFPRPAAWVTTLVLFPVTEELSCPAASLGELNRLRDSHMCPKRPSAVRSWQIFESWICTTSILNSDFRNSLFYPVFAETDEQVALADLESEGPQVGTILLSFMSWLPLSALIFPWLCKVLELFLIIKGSKRTWVMHPFYCTVIKDE